MKKEVKDGETAAALNAQISGEFLMSLVVVLVESQVFLCTWRPLPKPSLPGPGGRKCCLSRIGDPPSLALMPVALAMLAECTGTACQDHQGTAHSFLWLLELCMRLPLLWCCPTWVTSWPCHGGATHCVTDPKRALCGPFSDYCFLQVWIACLPTLHFLWFYFAILRGVHFVFRFQTSKRIIAASVSMKCLWVSFSFTLKDSVHPQAFQGGL